MGKEKEVYQSCNLDLISEKARETLKSTSSTPQAPLAHIAPFAENLSSGVKC